MATVLGVGDNSGSDTLTVTLTAAEPASSSVHVIHAAAIRNQAFFITPSVVGLPADSQGGTWSTGAGHTPILGAIQNGNSGAPPGSRTALQLGQTGLRTAGTALGIGDTVTVTWNDHGAGAAAVVIIAVVVAFTTTEYSTTTDPQYLGGTTPGDFVGDYYANGVINSDMGPFDGHTLNWTSAFAGTLTPYPRDSCTLLAAAASYPGAVANGYTPAVGSTIFQHDSADGNLSIAASLAAATALTAIEPGGSYNGSALSIMVGQYQFALGSVAPTKRCKTCGGMLGGISVGSTFTRWV
jgi:hypothetical protein